MNDLLIQLAKIWTMDGEQDREKYRPVKYIVRQMWPKLAELLDECAFRAMLLEKAMKGKIMTYQEAVTKPLNRADDLRKGLSVEDLYPDVSQDS